MFIVVKIDEFGILVSPYLEWFSIFVSQDTFVWVLFSDFVVILNIIKKYIFN